MKSRVSVVVLLVLALSLVLVAPASAAPVLTDGLDFSSQDRVRTRSTLADVATVGAVLHREGRGHARLCDVLAVPRPQLGVAQRVRRGGALGDHRRVRDHERPARCARRHVRLHRRQQSARMVDGKRGADDVHLRQLREARAGGALRDCACIGPSTEPTADCEVARCDDAVCPRRQPVGLLAGLTAAGGSLTSPCPAGADLIFAVYVNPTNAPSLSFSAPSVCAYQSAKVSGYLKDVGAKPLEGKPIEIQYLASGSWKTVKTVNTNAAGYYSATMTPSAKTTYRAYFAGDADYPPAASTSKVVLPRPRLTRSTNWLTLLLNKTYYFRGYIEPRHASAEPKLVVKAYKRRRDGSYPAMTSPTATFSGRFLQLLQLDEERLRGTVEARPRRARGGSTCTTQPTRATPPPTGATTQSPFASVQPARLRLRGPRQPGPRFLPARNASGLRSLRLETPQAEVPCDHDWARSGEGVVRLPRSHL